MQVFSQERYEELEKKLEELRLAHCRSMAEFLRWQATPNNFSPNEKERTIEGFKQCMEKLEELARPIELEMQDIAAHCEAAHHHQTCPRHSHNRVLA